ncbi:MAG: tetratricopeptide repeat protein [Anaerolineae bacterium]
MPIFLAVSFEKDVPSDIRALTHDVLASYQDAIGPACPRTLSFVLPPSHALRCTLDLHQRLETAQHPAALGLHVGKAQRFDNLYLGPALDHTCSIAEAGRPGQILLTQAFLDTYPLPPEFSVEDLGWHRLKDLAPAEHLYQLRLTPQAKYTPPALRTLSRVPHNLPIQNRAFIGRQKERQVLREILTSADRRLITLKGPGGIGKTRLALQVAAEVAPDFPGGVYFIPLASLTSPERLLSRVMETLDLKPQGTRDVQEQILRRLRRKTTLLILDSFEHLLPASTLLTQWLERVPTLRLLVTSREALNLPQETVYSVGGLPCPLFDTASAPSSTFSGPPFFSYDAIQLFFQAARRAAPLFVFTETDVPAVTRICHKLGGMPLGIELAASWTCFFSVQEIADQVLDDMDTLVTRRRDIPARHRSLHRVFKHSWDLLTSEEQEIFPALTVFRDGFRKEAVRNVIGAPETVLASLQAKSLLFETPEGRFNILQPLHHFGAEILSAQPERQRRLQDRHATYYTGLAAKRTAELWDEHQPTFLRQMTPEMENLRAAWRWASEQGHVNEVAQAIEFMYRFHQVRGYYREGERLFRFAREKLRARFVEAETTPPEVRNTLARLQEGAAMFAFNLSRLETARQAFEESLRVLREVHNQRDEAFVLLALGMIAYQAGRLEEARHHFQQSYSLFKRLEEPIGTSRAVFQLGNVHYAAGRYREAFDHYRRSKEMHETLGDRLGLADCLSATARVETVMGRLSAAEKALAQSREIYREMEDKRGLASAEIEIGLIASARGHYQIARRHFEQALSLRQELGDPTQIAEALVYLAGIYYSRGETKRVEELIAQVRHLYTTCERPVVSGMTMLFLGVHQFSQGKGEEATHSLESALHIMTHSGYHRERLLVEGYLIMALLFRGELERAARLCRESLACIDATGAQLFRGYRLNGLGMIALARGSQAQAKTYFHQALELGIQMGLQPVVIEALQNLAGRVIVQRDPETAVTWLTWILHQPAADVVQRQIAQKTLDQLVGHLSAERVKAAHERGLHLTLDEIAAQIRSDA